MITVKSNVYSDNEKLALYHSLNDAVTSFINNYCDVKSNCQTCKYRHVCYDLIKARDYSYRIATNQTK